MTLTTISIIIATTIFVAYNAVSLANFGIPESLSNTYYLWKEKNGKGWLFCLMMYAVVALMMPAWITLSEGSTYQFLAFLAPASIAFVGTAPMFKDDKLEGRVHTWAAVVAAVCSLAWVILVTPYWFTIPIFAFVFVIKAWYTKSIKTAYTYWLEMVAFGATFTSAIMYSL
jgi:hypothetical protein